MVPDSRQERGKKGAQAEGKAEGGAKAADGKWASLVAGSEPQNQKTLEMWAALCYVNGYSRRSGEPLFSR